VINRRQFVAAALPALSAACRSHTGPSSLDYALVANEGSQSIAVVQLAGKHAFTVVRQIAFDEAPSAMLSHANRPLIYALTPGTGTIHEIDIKTWTIVRKVKASATALSMRMSEDRAANWVLSRDERQLIHVPLDSLRPDTRIPLPSDHTDFDLASWTNLCGVAFGQEGLIGIVDLGTKKLERPVKVADSIGSVRFRSDGKVLLVANTADRAITLVQAPGSRIISHLMMAIRPDQMCFGAGGGQLFVTGDGSDVVVVVYPYEAPYYVAVTALVGRAPGAMAISKNYLFLANPLSADVSIFDITSNKVIAVAGVGAEPNYITFTPDQLYALVLNRQSGDMAVIRIGAIRADRSKKAALFTMIPVGLRPVSALVRSV